jgi:hypothetical protein
MTYSTLSFAKDLDYQAWPYRGQIAAQLQDTWQPRGCYQAWPAMHIQRESLAYRRLGIKVP